jgi:hypothetical protein
MDVVHRNMLLALTHPQERAYANDLHALLLCTEEIEPQEAPWSLREIHKQACKSIFSMAALLHHSSVVPHLQTYINVYVLWYACMRVIFDEAHQLPQHPKHQAMQYIKRLSSRKLTVMLPAVCFWVSVKCSDSIKMRAQNVASMIDAVHNDRGDRNLLQYRLRDLQDTEHALLQLLDFDILREQDKIDSMEEIIRAQFADTYESKEAQSQILRIIFLMFDEVGAKWG